ncbi:MAG TPA: class I SAM-dependent methyltransferase [Thermoanaerobaculia bacterium]|jgi:ubiquinone/menaquinone biosynthesis C-methylase UbiE|nr:class I SAM-dependent methyltransferase [Thermoanaerobaculia bacterium]
MLASVAVTHDFDSPAFVDSYDELPLWSAMFGSVLLERVPLDANTIALDVGCGTGFPLLELAQRLGPGSFVHGLDPWVTAVVRAERKRRQSRVTNAALRIGDAAAMPFRDHSFDLVVSNLGLNNFADAHAAVVECRRVLRRGGVLALTTNLVGHMREFYEVFESVLPADKRSALHAHIEHRATVDSLRKLLDGAGFFVRAEIEDTFTMRYANGAALLSHDFIRFGFLPAWRDVAGEEEVFAEVAVRLPSPLTLTIPRAYVEAV